MEKYRGNKEFIEFRREGQLIEEQVRWIIEKFMLAGVQRRRLGGLLRSIGQLEHRGESQVDYRGVGQLEYRGEGQVEYRGEGQVENR